MIKQQQKSQEKNLNQDFATFSITKSNEFTEYNMRDTICEIIHFELVFSFLESRKAELT